ncbi:hypothetical protein FRB96_007627 [Tulasnella sp. 330]|nr:hypothetical protein FRB96_007627 [Tulasnella sp. 330]
MTTLCGSSLTNLKRRPPRAPFLFFLSDRSATLILAVAGTIANSFITSQLLALWFSFRLSSEAESEWEGLSWRVDGAKALGAVICAYFAVGGLASLVGVVGVIKQRPSNVRLFRDYSIADLSFAFTATTMFAFASTQATIRSGLCEELSRQPDLLRHLSDHAGLNVENCEGFLAKGTVGVVMMLFVILFLRLQFTLTVLNYYAHLRGSELSQATLLPLTSRHTSSSSSPSQRILLISSPSPTKRNNEEDSVWVYSKVQVPRKHVERLGAREAFLSIPPSPPTGTKDGAIALPIREGEAPWTRGGHVRRMTLEEYKQFKDEK